MSKKVDVCENKAEGRSLLTTQDKCDKIDYLIAVGSGAIGGIIDIFLVGAPGDSKLQIWTDNQVEHAVISFAKILKWNPRSNETDTIRNAISFLEQKFKVNYDQSISTSAQDVLGITPLNHHMKSLAHSPDIIGLFFSILNQFTSTSTFFSDGKLIWMDTDIFELIGGNIIAKLFCGVANWFGHLISDVSGSSGSKGRGSGIVMPFYELFNACDFGDIDLGGNSRGTVADLATKAFENGYDARFALTMAIPVVITDLVIRLVWALRRRFQFHLPIKECIPMRKYADLRVMLMVGNGTLCVMDIVDAGVESRGDKIQFFMRLNLVAWYKLVRSVLIEVCIQLGINADFDAQVEAFRRINDAVTVYLVELKSIDFDAYKKEVEGYEEFAKEIKNVHGEDALNHILLNYCQQLKIEKAWNGDFDEFMDNKENHLVFQ